MTKNKDEKKATTPLEENDFEDEEKGKGGIFSKCYQCPGFERCHPCAWIPCSPYARKLHKKASKVRNGYKPDRWPTDFICLFLFAMFWVGMVVIACFAVWSGNPYTLIAPTDYQDNICGRGLGEGNENLWDLSDKPVLWFPFSFDTELSRVQFIDALYMGICVEKCPESFLGFNYTNVINNFGNFKDMINENMIICNYDKQDLPVTEKIYHVGNQSGCFLNVFPTKEFQDRCIPFFTQSEFNFTVPSQAQFFVDTILEAGNTLRAGFIEVRIAWFPLVVNAILIILLCYVLSCCINLNLVKLFVTLTIIGVWGLLVGFTGFVGWAAYDRYTNAVNDAGIVDDTTRIISYVLMGIAGALFIIDILYICVILFLARRIRKAADIIKLSSKAILGTPTLLILPPITFFCLAAVTAYWLMIAGYIQSSTLPVSLSTEQLSALPISALPVNSTSSYTIRRGNGSIQALQWYHLFGYLWTLSFISALGYTTTAGVVSQWFFSSEGDPEKNFRNSGKYKKKSEWFTVIRSFLRTLIFHTGSLLFGSVLVAIVQIFRVAYRRLESLVTKILALSSVGNPAVLACVLCVKCCIRIWLFLFAQLVKFFNKNAYIMMMIHGGSFLNSGARAFSLITENIATVGTTHFLGHAMLFLGQVMITIWGGFQTWILIYLLNRYEARVVMGEVVYYVIPVIAGFLLSFIIAGMFSNVYSTAIETILLCYLEDRKVRKNYPYTPPPLRNDGFLSLIIPSCVSIALRKVKKMNKKKDEEDEEKEKSKSKKK